MIYSCIATSVIVSVTGAPPFNAAVDQDLSIAYISAFILIFMVGQVSTQNFWTCVNSIQITLFPLGGSRLIAMDFAGPDVEPGKVKEAVRRRRQAFLYAVPNAISRLTERYRSDTTRNPTDFTDVEKSAQPAAKPSDYQSCENDPDIHGLSIAIATSTGKHVASQRDFTSVDGGCSPIYSRTPGEAGVGSSLLTFQGPIAGDETLVPSHENIEHSPIANASIVESSSKANNSSVIFSAVTPVSKRSVQFLRSFASTLLTPASITILLAFLIALIPPLKGLFTPLPVSNSTSTFTNPHIHPAPDSLPPLSIILDTTTFIGAASVPLGLICLGSALARLEIPRNQWGTLPTSAITLLAIGKMVITPILGVGIVQGLVTGGMISEDDKLLQFVCMSVLISLFVHIHGVNLPWPYFYSFFSCLPTATTQVYLTQVFSGTGSAEHLPAFLIPQYILMFISMTALTAYALHLLFWCLLVRRVSALISRAKFDGREGRYDSHGPWPLYINLIYAYTPSVKYTKTKGEYVRTLNDEHCT